MAWHGYTTRFHGHGGVTRATTSPICGDGVAFSVWIVTGLWPKTWRKSRSPRHPNTAPAYRPQPHTAPRPGGPTLRYQAARGRAHPSQVRSTRTRADPLGRVRRIARVRVDAVDFHRELIEQVLFIPAPVKRARLPIKQARSDTTAIGKCTTRQTRREAHHRR
jgi:hypothetical protein